MIQQSASIRAQFQGPSRHQLEWVSSGVWDKRTLADQLLVRATASPNAVAIIDGNARITLEGLAADALALSAALHARGLRPGDVVAFQAPNWGEAVVINDRQVRTPDGRTVGRLASKTALISGTPVTGSVSGIMVRTLEQTQPEYRAGVKVERWETVLVEVTVSSS